MSGRRDNGRKPIDQSEASILQEITGAWRYTNHVWRSLRWAHSFNIVKETINHKIIALKMSERWKLDTFCMISAADSACQQSRQGICFSCNDQRKGRVYIYLGMHLYKALYGRGAQQMVSTHVAHNDSLDKSLRHFSYTDQNLPNIPWILFMVSIDFWHRLWDPFLFYYYVKN